MLDPSILCTVDFWEEAEGIQRNFRTINFPESIKQITNLELREFYGGYLPEERVLRVEELTKRCQEYFQSFSFRKYSEEIPKPFREAYRSLGMGLERSTIPRSIQNVLLDEFAFLITQSSILSRMKKVFKVFENLKAIPLLNLEKRVPEEWKETVNGIKKAGSIINWIGFLGGYSIILPFPMSPVVGGIVEGVRLILLDP